MLLTMLLSPFATRVFGAGAVFALALVAGAAAPWSVVLRASAAAAAERWIAAEPLDDDPEGYTLYVEDTDAAYPGYKAEGFVDAAPEAAAALTWTLMTGQDFVPKGQTRAILRQTDQELLLHTFIDMPVMVLHGEADRVVPPEMGRAVFEAARHPKESHFVPHFGHEEKVDLGAPEQVLGWLEEIRQPAD